MVGDLQAIEPESTQSCQDAPLVGNAVGQHPIERTQTIGRDQKKPIAQIINVAYLAAALGKGSRPEVCFEQSHNNSEHVHMFRLRMAHVCRGSRQCKLILRKGL